MNKLKLLLVSIMVASSLVIDAGPKEDAIAERIKKVGSVCIQGSDCEQNEVAATIASVDPGVGSTNSVAGQSARSTYAKTCATCHNPGIAGAPKFGDAAQWAPRLAKGVDVLYASSINGLPPGMPAKGMCFSCSDDELKALVDYMVDAVK